MRLTRHRLRLRIPARGLSYLAVWGVAFTVLSLASSAALAAINPKKAVWGPTWINGDQAFSTYRDLGVGTYSQALDWSKVAPGRSRPKGDLTDPNNPSYRWLPSLDEAVKLAGEYGIQVNIQLTYAPPWANGGQGRNWAPLHPTDFANFAAAASRRYPSVRLWSIWGEANSSRNFMPLDGASGNASRLTYYEARGIRVYANILDASYASLKQVNSRNKVIGGATFASGDIRTPLWIRYLRTSSGLPPRLDMYSHNAFSKRKPNLLNPLSPAGGIDLSDVPTLERLVADNLGKPFGKAVVPLFLSEWCVPTSAGDPEFHFYVSERQQAEWINAAMQIVNRTSYINSIGWIHLMDAPPAFLHISSGLLDWTGRRKPGFTAFAAG